MTRFLSTSTTYARNDHRPPGPLDTVRRQMREGTARPSFARFILEHQKQYQLEDKQLGYIAGGMWRPVTLGGFAHRATKDIIWNNYLIPAGATVIGNHWAIANDPKVFPEPHKFNPHSRRPTYNWIQGWRVRKYLRLLDAALQVSEL
ncbi:uncharacterized protein HD556DRAFT_1447446 [Suillus plorans]|uniref:Uncharacterized protein n=1 Tax=Suillus plorans TaxID=116603 RepID=A0A9P7AIC9_9AGAM|nr:uncharacterized protein HD556DRAFT_1447446 [Suillus plorans]KAG1788973.1 hypothetical protein HD556DRAFT_1447446 [Suillus plorans]